MLAVPIPMRAFPTPLRALPTLLACLLVAGCVQPPPAVPPSLQDPAPRLTYTYPCPYGGEVQEATGVCWLEADRPMAGALWAGGLASSSRDPMRVARATTVRVGPGAFESQLHGSADGGLTWHSANSPVGRAPFAGRAIIEALAYDGDTLHALGSLRNTVGPPRQVHTMSNDHGATWSPVRTLSNATWFPTGIAVQDGDVLATGWTDEALVFHALQDGSWSTGSLPCQGASNPVAAPTGLHIACLRRADALELFRLGAGELALVERVPVTYEGWVGPLTLAALPDGGFVAGYNPLRDGSPLLVFLGARPAVVRLWGDTQAADDGWARPSLQALAVDGRGGLHALVHAYRSQEPHDVDFAWVLEEQLLLHLVLDPDPGVAIRVETPLSRYAPQKGWTDGLAASLTHWSPTAFGMAGDIGVVLHAYEGHAATALIHVA